MPLGTISLKQPRPQPPLGAWGWACTEPRTNYYVKQLVAQILHRSHMDVTEIQHRSHMGLRNRQPHTDYYIE